MDCSIEGLLEETVDCTEGVADQVVHQVKHVCEHYANVAISGCCCFSLFYLLTVFAPVISLHLLYIPALDQTWNSTTTADPNLYFSLKLKNPNDNQGVYYDPINVTIYDSSNRVHPIGNFTIPQFYQGRGKTAMKSGRVLLDHYQAELGAVLHVDVATSVRYKTRLPSYWISKRNHVKVGAVVKISDQGSILNPDKEVELKSSCC